MSLYYENLQPQAEANYAVNGVAFATNKPAYFGSTVAIAGAVTMASTLNVTGVTTFTGTSVFSGGLTYKVVDTAAVGATVVLTAANSGTTYIMSASSGTPSFTLPTAAAGLEFTFVTGNTFAGYTITGGTVHLKTSATGTAVSGTTVTNTQATAVVGDALTIVCDGTAWWMVAQTGIFTAA